MELDISTATLILILVNIAVGSENQGKDVKAKGDYAEENYGVKYASKCEVCKLVTREVEHQLNSKFRSPEVIQTGYNYLQENKKKQKTTVYEKSMIRLQEALESTCDAMLEYNIHKERNDWTRFARGQSQTFSTLHGLRNKGVKVDLGMPEEMWDKPSAEITQLKSQCDNFLESNEEAIENWYQDGGDTPLEKFVCKKTLKKKEQGCLADVPKQISPPSTSADGTKEKAESATSDDANDKTKSTDTSGNSKDKSESIAASDETNEKPAPTEPAATTQDTKEKPTPKTEL